MPAIPGIPGIPGLPMPPGAAMPPPTAPVYCPGASVRKLLHIHSHSHIVFFFTVVFLSKMRPPPTHPAAWRRREL